VPWKRLVVEIEILGRNFDARCTTLITYAHNNMFIGWVHECNISCRETWQRFGHEFFIYFELTVYSAGVPRMHNTYRFRVKKFQQNDFWTNLHVRHSGPTKQIASRLPRITWQRSTHIIILFTNNIYLPIIICRLTMQLLN